MKRENLLYLWILIFSLSCKGKDSLFNNTTRLFAFLNSSEEKVYLSITGTLSQDGNSVSNTLLTTSASSLSTSTQVLSNTRSSSTESIRCTDYALTAKTIQCMMIIKTANIAAAESGCYSIYYGSAGNRKYSEIAKFSSITKGNEIQFILSETYPTGASEFNLYNCNGSETFLTSLSLTDYEEDDGVLSDSNGSYTVQVEIGKSHQFSIRRATKDLGDISIDLRTVTTATEAEEIRQDPTKLSLTIPSGFEHQIQINTIETTNNPTTTASTTTSSTTGSSNSNTNTTTFSDDFFIAEANNDTLFTPSDEILPSISFSNSSLALFVGVAMTVEVPSITGTITSCSISPALPSGLTLNTTNCSISGTPSLIQASTTYVVTATNAVGSSNSTISITVTTPTVATPTFSLPAGNYSSVQNISLSTTTAGATLYFTTDGSTPTNGSTVYTSAFNIWLYAGKTIQVIATAPGYADSTVASATYSLLPLSTSLVKCYNVNVLDTCSVSYIGQDGYDQKGTTRSYTIAAHATYTSDYTTTDNVTGLVWRTCDIGKSGASCAGSTSTMTWADAGAAAGCGGLNTENSGSGYAGLTNWRLPTRLELQSISDYNYANPSINSTYFPNTQGGNTNFWTSSVDPANGSKVWIYRFYDTHNRTVAKTGSGRVKCVSGTTKEYTPSTYTDNGDGTVYDHKTGLTWQKCSKGQGATTCTGSATGDTWADSIIYCNSLSLAGRTWRMPNIHEILSIYDYTRTAPQIDTTAFPNTSGIYYTSTTALNNTNYTNGVYFNATAYVGISAKGGGDLTRCVSGP